MDGIGTDEAGGDVITAILSRNDMSFIWTVEPNRKLSAKDLLEA